MSYYSVRRLYALWSVLFLSFFFLLPDLLLNGSSPFLDSPIRISSASAFAETYSFWWTTLLYLSPFFFFLSLTLFSLLIELRSCVWSFFLFSLFTSYLIEFVDYTPLNVNDVMTTYTEYGSNVLLTNPLNRYHPFVFYLSAISFFLVTAPSVSTWINFNTFQVRLSLQITKTLSWLSTHVNLIALFMGSWWALQEGTWGGWWNWDSSETLGLEVSIFILVLIHTSAAVKNFVRLTLRSTLFLSFFISSYFFIQLNFELVSHNFGSKFFFFFNNNLFSIEIILVTWLLIAYLIRTDAFNGVKYSLYGYALTSPSLGCNFSSPILKLLPHCIIAWWVIWSYKPLINYFIWNFAGLNSFNYEGCLQPYNVSLALILLTWLAPFYLDFLSLLCVLTLCSGNWLWPLLTSVPILLRPSRLHFSLLVFSTLNLTLFGVVFSAWFPQTTYLNTSYEGFTTWRTSGVLSADVNSWESIQLQTTLTGYCHTSWNLIANSNIPSINFFSLNVTQSFSTNYYNLGSSYTTSQLLVELPAVASLALIFYTGITLSHLLKNRIDLKPF